MALAIDGSPSTHYGGTNSTWTHTITTSSANDIIVVDFMTNGGPGLSVVGSTLGAFSRRSNAGATSAHRVERWYKVATGILSSEVVTVTATSSAVFSSVAYAISGADITTIWDVSPVSASSPGDPLSVTNMHAPTIVLGAFMFGSTASPTPGAGYTALASANGGSFLSEYQVLALQQPPFPVTVTTGNGLSSAGIADVVLQAGSIIVIPSSPLVSWIPARLRTGLTRSVGTGRARVIHAATPTPNAATMFPTTSLTVNPHTAPVGLMAMSATAGMRVVGLDIVLQSPSPLVNWIPARLHTGRMQLKGTGRVRTFRGSLPGIQPSTVTLVGHAGIEVDAVSESPVIGSPVLMVLEGGPLDGERQIVEMVPTAIGAEIVFNLPNYQTFDPDQPDEIVLSQGLQATYASVGPGLFPGPGDDWVSSWIFGFTGESYVPTPEPLPPPGPVVVELAQVFMFGDTTLVPDTLPIIITPTVSMVSSSVLDVEPVVIPTKAGVVVMSGQTVVSVTPDWSPQVFMTAQTSYNWPSEVHMSAQSSMMVGPPDVQMSAQASMTATASIAGASDVLMSAHASLMAIASVAPPPGATLKATGTYSSGSTSSGGFPVTIPGYTTQAGDCIVVSYVCGNSFTAAFSGLGATWVFSPGDPSITPLNGVVIGYACTAGNTTFTITMASNQTIAIAFAVFSGIKSSASPLVTYNGASSGASNVASVTSPSVPYSPGQVLFCAGSAEIFGGSPPLVATWGNGHPTTPLSAVSSAGTVASSLDQGSSSSGSSTTVQEAFTTGSDRLRVMVVVLDHA